MATVNSAGASAVIPSGYYTSQGFQALSQAQQAAATGAQGLLTSRQNLFASMMGSSASPTPFGVQINGATTPGGIAAQEGSAALQQSQSSLLGTLTTTAGWLPSSVFQLNLLQSLTRTGLLGYSEETPTAAQTASTGAVDVADDRQLLVNTLSDPSSTDGGTALSGYLSGLYNQAAQFSLVPRGSGVGSSLNATA